MRLCCKIFLRKPKKLTQISKTLIDCFSSMLPSSTKNAQKARDPEMHQTKKGNEWKFGMKCHIGVDAGSSLAHTLTVTAANEHDITQTANLLREDDEVAYGDSAHLGTEKRPEIANNEHFPKIDSESTAAPAVCLFLGKGAEIHSLSRLFLVKFSLI